jgi:hypothetical protein
LGYVRVVDFKSERGPVSGVQPIWTRAALIQLAVSLIVIVLPVVMFSHPALLDYQNHATRLWIIATNDTGAGATPFFRVDWSHINNDLGIDAIAQGLRGHLAPDIIGRLCLAAAILLPTAGAVALNIQIFGRLSSFQLLIPFFAWTLTAVAGFMNFQIGLGLGLLFLALEPTFQRGPRWLPWVGRSVCALVLFLDHPLALTFYALLQAGWAFGPEGVRSSDTPLPRRLLRAALTPLICAVPIIVATLVSRTVPGNLEEPTLDSQFYWNSPLQLLKAIGSPLITYNMAIDLGIALLMVSLLIFALVRGKLKAHTGLVSLAIGLMLLEMVAPNGTPQGGWTDRRLPIMALLMVLSSIQISFLERRRSQIAFAVLAFLLLAGRTAWIAYNWQGAERLTESVSAALEDVPAGAMVLPVQHLPTKAELDAAPPGRFIYRNEPTYRHLPTLAISERRAFVPTLFAQLGVHPVEVNQPWKEFAFVEGGELASVAALSDPSLIALNAPYVREWRTRFDYVLVLNADYVDRHGGGERLPAELVLVKDAGFAKLYRITHVDGGQSPGAIAAR